MFVDRLNYNREKHKPFQNTYTFEFPERLSKNTLLKLLGSVILPNEGNLLIKVVERVAEELGDASRRHTVVTTLTREKMRSAPLWAAR